MLSKLVIEVIIKNPNKPGDSRSDVEAEQALAESVTKNVVAQIQQQGYVFVGGGARWVTRVTREDAIQFTPRKMHMQHEEGWLCRTEHVSLRRVVTDEALVTCKLCLTLLKERHEAPPSES